MECSILSQALSFFCPFFSQFTSFLAFGFSFLSTTDKYQDDPKEKFAVSCYDRCALQKQTIVYVVLSTELKQKNTAGYECFMLRFEWQFFLGFVIIATVLMDWV